MTPPVNDDPFGRRKDDVLQGKILATVERIDKRQEKIDDKLNAVLDGTRKLPQCRESEKRIDGLEKKVSQHSFGGLDQRVTVVEKRMDEQKEWNVWALRSAVGAAIVSAIYALRDKIFH